MSWPRWSRFLYYQSIVNIHLHHFSCMYFFKFSTLANQHYWLLRHFDIHRVVLYNGLCLEHVYSNFICLSHIESRRLSSRILFWHRGKAEDWCRHFWGRGSSLSCISCLNRWCTYPVFRGSSLERIVRRLIFLHHSEVCCSCCIGREFCQLVRVKWQRLQQW